MRNLRPARLCMILFAIQVIGFSSLDFDAHFDVREASIKSVHSAIFSARTSSCRDVVSAFLSYIKAHDSSMHAIISLNPNALTDADILDESIATGNTTGSLFCIPILLKDNFDAVGMNTTAGSLALKNSRPSIDAPVVAALRAAGAIILGKSSMHEFALEGISVSSIAGQTTNPYDHTRTPGGSSGGTGAAIAASFAVWGTGTDTVNSLRNPASANSLYSVRPTFGLISRAGLVPNSYSQDSCGPIARNIEDLAIAFRVMASVGKDPADNATALIPATSIDVDYTAGLFEGSLSGVRFGLIEGFFNRTLSDETTPVNNAMADMVTILEKTGATVVPITDPLYNSTSIFTRLDVQRFEWKETIEAYLQNPSLKGPHPLTLEELYATKQFLVLPRQYEFVKQAMVSSTKNETYPAVKAGISDLIASLKNTFVTNQLDALIYPEQQNLVVKIGSPVQSGRNGILAAVTGSPVVTVPAGFSPATGDAPVGVPIGMEILGLPWSEKRLLNLAAHISRLEQLRKPPILAGKNADLERLDTVPVVVPDAGNALYPVGVL